MGTFARFFFGLGFLSLAAPAPAAVFLVDFSTDAAGAGGPNGKWNAFAAPSNVNGGTLLDSTNAATSVTLRLVGTATDNSQLASVVFDNNQSGFEGSPSWATSTTDNSASGDFFYTSNSATATPHTYTVTFGGLTAGDRFSLDLLASRNSTSAKGFYEYSLDGGANWSGFSVLNHDGTPATNNNWSSNTTQSQFFLQTEGFANHRYLNVNDIGLTGSTLQVRITDADAATSTFTVINAMRLTVVPEPSLIGIAGVLASLGLLRRRLARV